MAIISEKCEIHKERKRPHAISEACESTVKHNYPAKDKMKARDHSIKLIGKINNNHRFLVTEYSQANMSMAWLRQKALWLLGKFILVLVIGPFLSAVVFALILFTVYYSGYSQKAGYRQALAQTWFFMGIRMALVGTEVIVLRYGLLHIADMLQTGGILLEHLGHGIRFEHIGIYYFPIATVMAFKFSWIFFRYMLATMVNLSFLSSKTLPY